jgi:hypothetical protein
MKPLLIILVALAVAGCAGTPTAPAVGKEAVYMPCNAPVPEKPVFPADTLTGDEDLWTIGKTLWADHKARQAYELEIRTALEGCVK